MKQKTKNDHNNIRLSRIDLDLDLVLLGNTASMDDFNLEEELNIIDPLIRSILKSTKLWPIDEAIVKNIKSKK